MVGTSSLLVLDPVRKEDGGSYQCSAENELGLAKPQAVHLNVLCKYTNFIAYYNTFNKHIPF